MGFNKLKVLWLFAIFVQFGGYASSFDKTDRKISAQATLQTPFDVSFETKHNHNWFHEISKRDVPEHLKIRCYYVIISFLL